MASSGSSSSAAGHVVGSPFAFSITEKLSRNNLGLWKLQVLPAIRSAQLEGYLDGSKPVPPKEIDVKNAEGKVIKDGNPEYSTWVAHDQQVFGYLLSTMSRDAMAQVATTKTAAELWTAVGEIFSSQTRSRTVNTYCVGYYQER